MGFMGRAIGTALLGPAGYMIGNQFDQDKGSGPSGPMPWKPITAKNALIPAGLADTMGSVGTNAYNKISSNYAGAKAGLAGDAAARGMSGAAATGAGSYAGDRLAVNQKQDIGGLESALGGQLGNSAYQDVLSNRDYNQNLNLTDQIANLNRPSKLQELFNGIGAVGKPLSVYAGMKGGGKSGAPAGGNAGGAPFPQGEASMNMPLGGYPKYLNNPYLNGGF